MKGCHPSLSGYKEFDGPTYFFPSFIQMHLILWRHFATVEIYVCTGIHRYSQMCDVRYCTSRALDVMIRAGSRLFVFSPHATFHVRIFFRGLI